MYDTRLTPRWRLVLVVLLMLEFLCVHSDIKCSRYCQCSHRRMKCVANKFPLKYIPKVPEQVTDAEIEFLNLTEVTRQTLVNLTTCKLERLTLYHCYISAISDDAFADLRFLTNLKIEQNYLTFASIGNLTSGVSKSIAKLYIKAEQSDVSRVDSVVFTELKKLTTLTFSLGHLTEFEANSLSEIPLLERVNLSSNSLNRLHLDRVIPNVTHLYLAGNDFNSFPHICKSGTPVLPRLKSLDMSGNAIKYVNVSSLVCLHNLLKLTLSNNRIEVLQDNAFADLRRLSSLYMSNLPLKKISDLAFNMSRLYKLYFTQMPIMSTRRFNPGALFRHSPNLGSLDMTNTKLDIGVSHWKDLLLGLQKVERLVLQRTYLKELPTGVFPTLTRLKRLVLSGNYIHNVGKGVFKNVTSIETLILDGNNIGMITEDSFPLEFRLHLKEINLGNNPFICTCDLLWFRTWMKEVIANKSIRFLNYPHRYFCRSPNVALLRLQDYNPTVESCKTLPWFAIFLPVFFSLVVLIVVVGAVAYHYRWHLLYWISLIKRRRQRQHAPLQDMKYDAFVSYANEDDDWVHEELIAFAEGDLELTLCEHSRDFEAGKLIIDNVINALDTSRKTILIISNDYMRSDWCQFELQMALNAFYKHETDLVVVLLEQINARHVTSTLRALMTSTTYMEWPDGQQARDLFKERLRSSLQN